MLAHLSSGRLPEMWGTVCEMSGEKALCNRWGFLFRSTDQQKSILVSVFGGRWVLESQPCLGRNLSLWTAEHLTRGVCVRVCFVQRLASKPGIQTHQFWLYCYFYSSSFVLSLRQEPSGAKEPDSRWFHDQCVHQRWINIAGVSSAA